MAQLYHRIALRITDIPEDELLEGVFVEQFGPLAEALQNLHETGNEKMLENLLSRDDANNVVWALEEQKGKNVNIRVDVTDISNEHKG